MKVHSALSENPNFTIRPLALPVSKFLKCMQTPQLSTGYCVRQSVTKWIVPSPQSFDGDLPATGLLLRPSDSSPRCSLPSACLSSMEGLTLLGKAAHRGKDLGSGVRLTEYEILHLSLLAGWSWTHQALGTSVSHCVKGRCCEDT